MKAIQTRYVGPDGTEDFFRSRQEARWAVFLDYLGIQWRYEYEGFDLGDGVWYLPDFWLPELEMWLEVKGKSPMLDEQDKAARLCQQSGFDTLISWTDFRGVHDDGLRFRKDGNGVFHSIRVSTLLHFRLRSWSLSAHWDIENACNAARQARFGRDGKARGYEHPISRRERVYADH